VRKFSNIYKIHGSLTWELNEESILFSKNLKQIEDINDVALTTGTMITIDENDSLADLQTKANAITYNSTEIENFMTEYEKLSIVNPTKDKFRETILNQTYYELLRIYANELEKENTVLFVMGFSFADEHIRELTLRVANSNPTLQIFIFAYDFKAEYDLKLKIKGVKYNNIKIIYPSKHIKRFKFSKNLNFNSLQPNDDIWINDFKYTFDEINTRVFKKLEDEVLKGA